MLLWGLLVIMNSFGQTHCNIDSNAPVEGMLLLQELELKLLSRFSVDG